MSSTVGLLVSSTPPPTGTSMAHEHANNPGSPSASRAPGDTAAAAAAAAPRPPPSWLPLVLVLFLAALPACLGAGVLPQVLVKHFEAQTYVLSGRRDAVKGFLAFVGTPVIGALSDVVGRRWLLILCVVCSSSAYAALGLGVSLEGFLVVDALSGLCSAQTALVFSCVADVTTPGSRARAYGLAMGAPLGALVVGPLIGSAVFEQWGISSLYTLFLMVATLNLLLSLCAIRETANYSEGSPRGDAHRPSPAAVLAHANPLRGLRLLRCNAAMRLLAALNALKSFAFAVMGLAPLYARRR